MWATHASLRNVIEWSFGVLKMKLCILLQLHGYPIEKQSMIIFACMALHNFIRDNDINDEHFETFVEDIRGVGSQVAIADGTVFGR